LRGILADVLDVGRKSAGERLSALHQDAQLATTLTGAALARHTQEASSFAC